MSCTTPPIDICVSLTTGTVSQAASKRPCDGGPPAELLPNSDDHVPAKSAHGRHPRRRHARPGQPARFDWPAGGTVEVLGRDSFARLLLSPSGEAEVKG